MSKTMCLLGILVLSLFVAMWGCGGDDGEETPSPAGGPHSRAIVVNGGVSSNDNYSSISSVDLVTGSVASNLGGITIGPNALRVKIRGDRAFIVNSGTFSGSTSASVQVVDLTTKSLVQTIAFEDGENPMDIAFVDDFKAYVTCLYGNNVTVIEDPEHTGQWEITETIALPVFLKVPELIQVNAGPTGIVIHGSYAYTANSGIYFQNSTVGYIEGSVSKINTTTDTLVGGPKILNVGVNPQDLDVDAEGNIWVISTGDYSTKTGTIEVLDQNMNIIPGCVLPVGGTPSTMTIGGGLALIGAGDSEGAKLFVVKADTSDPEIIHDNSAPLVLDNTSGWWMVGKIAVRSNGKYGYVPAGIGSASKLFEISLGENGVTKGRTFNLWPSAVFPSAVALLEVEEG